MGLNPSTPDAGAGQLPAPARLLDPYIVALTVLGAAMLAWFVAVQPPWQLDGVVHPSVYVALAFGLAAGESRPIPISRGQDAVDFITTSTPFALALVVLAPLSLLLVVAATAVVLDDLRMRRPWRKLCFNVGQYVVSLVAAALVLDLAGGPDLLSRGRPFDLADDVPALLAAGAVLVVLNYLLVAVVVTLSSGQSFRDIVADDLRFALTTSAVLVSLAPVTAFLAQTSLWMLLLLYLPMLAVHHSAAQAMLREFQALHDALTGLGNRELFQARAGRQLAAADAEAEAGPAVLLIALDHFDDVEDTLGHRIADAVLVTLARRLDAAVGPDGLVARVGDQFVALVPAGEGEAMRLAASLIEASDQPVEIDDARLLVQITVGVAVAPQHGSDPDTLLKNAGAALHDPADQASRVSLYRPEIDVGTLERLKLLAELRTAIDEGHLRLVFQPQVSLTTGAVIGVEALVRWQHPRRGTVMPDVFIGLAENAGLVGQVTAVVLDQALGTLARLWAAGHDVRMAVNVSARHMSDLSLPALVEEALARHAVPAGALTLEVTETGIFSEPARVDAVVRALRECGVSIAVDDYGTGQASLSYLKRLVVDELKIDKSFVLEMGSVSGDAILVRSTIELGHDLGLRIVAEGVEDAATLALLRRYGSDVAQGYHIGRPMPEADLHRLLDEWRARPPTQWLTAAGTD